MLKGRLRCEQQATPAEPQTVRSPLEGGSSLLA